jgi:hypothetical protein
MLRYIQHHSHVRALWLSNRQLLSHRIMIPSTHLNEQPNLSLALCTLDRCSNTIEHSLTPSCFFDELLKSWSTHCAGRI